MNERESPWPWITVITIWLSMAAIIVGLAFALPASVFTHEDGGFIFVILLVLIAGMAGTWCVTYFRR